MNLKIDNIKKLESPPKIIKNIFNKDEISSFLDVYKNLPITVDNKKQNVVAISETNKKINKIKVLSLIN